MTPAAAQIEALLVASPTPVDISRLQGRFGRSLEPEIDEIASFWKDRGFQFHRDGDLICLKANEAALEALMSEDGKRIKKLTEAAVETLVYISIHQPVTAKDIEKARGVTMFKGIMESLLDSGFVRVSSRKTDAGRAVAYVTTDRFLDHFGLSSLADMPTADEASDMTGALPEPDASQLSE